MVAYLLTHDLDYEGSVVEGLYATLDLAKRAGQASWESKYPLKWVQDGNNLIFRRNHAGEQLTIHALEVQEDE